MTTQNQTLVIKSTPQISLSPAARLRKLHTQMLIRMHLRSACCGGKLVAWHYNKFYCDTCDGWAYPQPQHH